jgi:arylsulfatase A-like enzyme
MVNIIYIHSHDTGRYIQPYGYAVETPNLQNFAEEGVLFRNAHCAAPTCSPSRSVLLTGQYAHQNGMLGLAHKGGHLADPSHHLANYLKSQGYATALSGVQHVTGHDVEDIKVTGYDRVLTREEWPAWADHFELWNQWYAKAAVDYLLRVDKSQPFFLDCGFDLTHRMGKGEQWHTMENPPAGDSRYVRPPSPLPDTPETRRDFADFRVAVNLLDECIGQLLSAIKVTGLAENTIVIVTTDHGLASPFMKCNLTGHGTGVMLMIRGPEGFTGGKVTDSPVSHVDIFPTICDVAGITAPEWLEGISLLPLINEGKPVRDAVYSEVNWHGYPEIMRSVRTERYNYIRRFSQFIPPLGNCDSSVSRTLLANCDWQRRSQSTEELYDLMFDPNEACNRAKELGYSDILNEMRSRLNDWMRKTDDPVISGKVEPWPDAVTRSINEDTSSGDWVPAETVNILEDIK